MNNATPKKTNDIRAFALIAINNIPNKVKPIPVQNGQVG
jgi:hypothetical protein